MAGPMGPSPLGPWTQPACINIRIQFLHFTGLRMLTTTFKTYPVGPPASLTPASFLLLNCFLLLLSNQLSLFYRNGTSLQQIVRIYRNEQDNDFLKFLGDYLFKEANKGLPLPVILMNLKCFQNDLIKFIEQGEKNGKLDIELKLYSQMLLQQFEEKVLKQTKFIQPIIFFILGIFIVSLYLVIMLPMFELMQTIK